MYVSVDRLTDMHMVHSAPEKMAEAERQAWLLRAHAPRLEVLKGRGPTPAFTDNLKHTFYEMVEEGADRGRCDPE
jgi:hypothetical protein